MRGPAGLLGAIAIGALGACASSPPAALSPEEEHLLRPIDGVPDSVRGYLDDGDRLFRRGIAPFRASDPQAPASDPSRIAEALDCYQQARMSYVRAQVQYSGLEPAPPALQERLRECVIRITTLERRRHAAAIRGPG